MSLQTTITYNTTTVAAFSAGSLGVTDSSFQLIIQTSTGLSFNEPFDTTTGFSFTASELSGGALVQSDQAPSDMTFHANYNNSTIGGAWGDGTLTGTPTGGVTITSNRLDMNSLSVAYVDYDAVGNADHQQVMTIDFDLIPNYSGAPSASQRFFTISEAAGSLNNEVNLYQLTNGNLTSLIRGETGTTLMVASWGAWSATANTVTSMRLQMDISTATGGDTRLFVNGTQLGAANTSVGVRSATITLFRIGADAAASLQSNFSIDNVAVYNQVQTTGSYSVPSLPVNRYTNAKAEVDEFQHTPIGNIIALSSITMTASGTPYFQFQRDQSGTYEYHNGGGWVTATDTYTSANTKAEVSTNIASLDVNEDEYLRVKVLFAPTDVAQSISDLTIGYTGNTGYDTSAPSIETGHIFKADAIYSITTTATTPANTNLRKTLCLNSQSYYWVNSTTGWATADGTYAQANSLGAINTNISSLDLTNGYNIGVNTFFNTDTATATPILTQDIVTFDFSIPDVTVPDECIVYGTVKDILGDASVTSAQVKVVNHELFEHGDVTIIPSVRYASITASGGFEISLVETASVSKQYQFFVVYKDNGVNIETTINRGYATVPNQNTVDWNDLTFSE